MIKIIKEIDDSIEIAENLKIKIIEKEKILNNNVGKEVLLSVPTIKTNNKKKDIKKTKAELKSLTFDPQNINNTEQIITKNDKKVIVTKEYKEDKLLIRKVNELENKLKK